MAREYSGITEPYGESCPAVSGPSLRVPLGEIFSDLDLNVVSGGNALEQPDYDQSQ